jgi:hypothetical protein
MIEAYTRDEFAKVWHTCQRDYPRAAAYLQPYVDIKHRWATCETNWYTMGTSVTSYVEASNSSFVSFMVSAHGNGSIINNVETSLRQERTMMDEEQKHMDDEFCGWTIKGYNERLVDDARKTLGEPACDRLANKWNESKFYKVEENAHGSTVIRKGKEQTVVWHAREDVPHS